MVSVLLCLFALQILLWRQHVSGTLPTSSRKGTSTTRQSLLLRTPSFMKKPTTRRNNPLLLLWGRRFQKRIMRPIQNHRNNNNNNNNRAPPFIILIRDLQRLSCLRGGDIIEPSSLEDLQDILQTHTNKLVVLDFYNDNCEPCQRIAPLFDAMSRGKEFAGKVIFAKVHVTQTPDITAHYGVTGWPTFFFIKHGQVQTEIMGGKLAEATLYDWIKLLMPKEDDEEEEKNNNNNNNNEPQSATVKDAEQEANAGRDDDGDGPEEELNLDDSNNSSG